MTSFVFNSTFATLADEKVKLIKKELVEQGMFVTVKDILLYTHRAFAAANPGLELKDLLLLPSIRTAQLIEKEMDVMIRAFISTSKLATVHDLSLYLSEQAHVVHFEACGLGKLIRHPYVAMHFKITKNIAHVEQITADEIYTSYATYLKVGVNESISENKNNKQQQKTRLKYTDLKFYSYMENQFRKPMASLGFIIHDFESFHDEMFKQLSRHVLKYNTYTQKLAKEQSQDYDELIEKSDAGKVKPWGDILKDVTSQYKENNPLGIFDEKCKMLALKWNNTCSDKPFHIAALSMAMSHLAKDTDTALHMASLYVYMEIKDAASVMKLNSFLVPLSSEDRRFVGTWAAKLKASSWKFDDFRKYMSQYYINTLREKNPRGDKFKMNIMLFLFIGRLILLSYIPNIEFDEESLNSLQPQLQITTKNMQTILQDAYGNLPSTSLFTLLDFQTLVSKAFGGCPFFMVNGAYVDFLEVVEKYLPEVDLSLRDISKPQQRKTLNNGMAFGDLADILTRIVTVEITCAADVIQTLHTIETEYYKECEESDLLSCALKRLADEDLDFLFQIAQAPSEGTKKAKPKFSISYIFRFLRQLLINLDTTTFSTNDYPRLIASLKEYMNVKDIEDLGHGKLVEILTLFDSDIEEYQDDIPNMIALSASHLNREIMSCSLPEECILDAIISSKYLVDLEVSVHWSLCDSIHSSFASFVKQNLNSIILQLKENGKQLIEMGFQKYSIIPLESSIDEYQLHFKAHDFNMALCCLVSETIKCGSVAQLSLSTLRNITSAIWDTHDTSLLIASYTKFVQAIALLPKFMATSLMKSIFLPCFAKSDVNFYQGFSVALNVLGYHPDWVITLGVLPLLKIVDESVSHTHKPSLKKFEFEPLEISVMQDFNDVTLDSATFPMEVCDVDEGSCRQVVANIRKQEFGLDIILNEENKSIIEAQHRRNCRALQRLSNELYSQDSHFVLELLQNADDNQYNADVIPSISFTITASGIQVYNNESGFSASNIKALCDVGKSTKAGLGESFIGQKGIGFKSVFRITDAPEIHSNGFHVQFKSQDFIVPTWLDDSSHLRTTTIILPFNAGIVEKGSKNILRKFQDIQPVVLLFLRRLSKVEIIDSIQGTTLTIEKRILAGDETLLSYNSQITRWKVHAMKFQLNFNNLASLSTLKIAIPLDFIDDKNHICVDTATYTPHHQDTFAFLPLRSYGFKFVLHGDFSVPSSREDVDHDSIWNEQLRSAIPALFADFAKKVIRDIDANYESEDKAKYASIFLKFVPLERDLFGFFKPVAKMIIEKMKEIPCIYTSDGNWHLPSKVAAYSKSSGQLFDDIPSDMICKSLGLNTIHPLMFVADSLQRSLGIKIISAGDMIQLLRYTSSLNGNNDRIIERGIKHFVILLDNESVVSKKLLVSELRILRLFRVRGDTKARALTADHFFYLDNDDEYYDSCVKYFSFLSKMNILDFNRYTLLREDKSLLQKLLGYLNIPLFTEKDIVQKFVLIEICKQGLNISRNDLIEYTFYLSSFISRLNKGPESLNLMTAIRDSLPLLTSNGIFLWDSISYIHLPKYLGGYFNSTDVCFWKTLDCDYLDWMNSIKLPTLDSECLLHLKEFFISLGLLDHIYITQSKVSFTSGSIDDTSMSDSEFLDDYESNELSQIFASFTELQKDLTIHNYQNYVLYAEGIIKLCKKLSANWISYYDSFTKAKVLVEEGDNHIIKKRVDSSFLSLLKISTWIPTTKGTVQMGMNLYAPLPEIKEILHDEVEYSAISNLDLHFSMQLGIKTTIQTEDLIAAFRKWIHSGKQYTFDLASLKMIYTILSKETIKQNLHIFIPFSSTFLGSKKEPGIFIDPTCCVWTDPDSVLDGWRFQDGSLVPGSVIILSMVYPSLDEYSTIFKSLGVSTQPGLLEYIKKLSNPTTSTAVSERSLAQFSMMSSILTKFDLNDISSHITRSLAFIPTQHGHFVSLGQKSYLNDDERLAILFHKNTEIFLIGAVGQSKSIPENVSSLFRRLGVRKLSESVEQKPIPLGSYTLDLSDDVLKVTVNSFICFLQKFGVGFDSKVEFEILLTDQLEVQLMLQGNYEYITRPYFIEQKGNVFGLTITRAGLKMMGELFMDLSVLINAPKAILEDIRAYFNRICQLVAFPEMIKSQLRHDGYISENNAEIRITSFVDNQESDDEDVNIIDDDMDGTTIDNNEAYESTSSHSRVKTPSINIVLGAKRNEMMNNSPQERERQKKHKNLVRDQEQRSSDPYGAQDSQLKDSYDAYLALNQEDVTTRRIDLSSIDRNSNKQTAKNTGLVGEEIAYLHLKEKFKNEKHLVVAWVNESTETGLPYDITVFDSKTRAICEFIEVKSTQNRWRDRFEVSTNEWQFARTEGEKFTILRVSGVNIVGSGDTMACSIVRFNDPHMLHKKRYLKLQHQLVVFPEN